jgi:hypothetical protein
MVRLFSMAKILSVLGILATLAGSAAAQMSVQELKQQIQERSTRIKEFRALLNDPDQTTRLAALDVMLKSDDSVMREVAYQMGFSSADETMRAVTLKNRIAALKTIIVKIENRDSASENEKKTIAKWGGAYTFDMKTFDEQTGHFETTGRYVSGSGQVVGTAFEFAQPYCKGTFRLGDGPVLEGELGCKKDWAGTFKGSIHLE